MSFFPEDGKPYGAPQAVVSESNRQDYTSMAIPNSVGAAALHPSLIAGGWLDAIH